jgi:hypothetical protein
VIRTAVVDYLRGCEYAYSRDIRRRSDNWLHRKVLVSVLCFGLTLVLPFAVLFGGQGFVNLLAVPVVFAIGLVNAAWIVHRYRRRDYPDPDALATVVHVALDKADEVRARRKQSKN